MFRSPYSGGRILTRADESIVIPWWLSGGISAANCIAAYQPKGAADYAASKVNLANPGTYDATEGEAPSWSAGGGWSFSGAINSRNLLTGITPVNNQTWSMFAFVYAPSPTASNTVIGSYTVTSPYPGIILATKWDNAAYMLYKNGGDLKPAPSFNTSGTIGFAGATAYRNGVYDGDIPPTAGVFYPMAIGAAMRNTGTVALHGSMNTYAISIYNSTLSLAQVSALTTAMNAL